MRKFDKIHNKIKYKAFGKVTISGNRKKKSEQREDDEITRKKSAEEEVKEQERKAEEEREIEASVRGTRFNE